MCARQCVCCLLASHPALILHIDFISKAPVFAPFSHQADRSSAEPVLNPFDFPLLLRESQSSGVSLRDMADSSGRSSIHKWPCIKLQNKHLAPLSPSSDVDIADVKSARLVVFRAFMYSFAVKSVLFLCVSPYIALEPKCNRA